MLSKETRTVLAFTAFMGVSAACDNPSEVSQTPFTENYSPSQMREVVWHRNDVLLVIGSNVADSYTNRGIVLFERSATDPSWLNTKQERFVGVGGPATDGKNADQRVIVVNGYESDGLTLKNSTIVTDLIHKPEMQGVINEQQGTIRTGISNADFYKAATDAVSKFIKLPDDMQLIPGVTTFASGDELSMSGHHIDVLGKDTRLYADRMGIKVDIRNSMDKVPVPALKGNPAVEIIDWEIVKNRQLIRVADKIVCEQLQEDQKPQCLEDSMKKLNDMSESNDRKYEESKQDYEASGLRRLISSYTAGLVAGIIAILGFRKLNLRGKTRS